MKISFFFGPAHQAESVEEIMTEKKSSMNRLRPTRGKKVHVRRNEDYQNEIQPSQVKAHHFAPTCLKEKRELSSHRDFFDQSYIQ